MLHLQVRAIVLLDKFSVLAHVCVCSLKPIVYVVSTYGDTYVIYNTFTPWIKGNYTSHVARVAGWSTSEAKYDLYTQLAYHSGKKALPIKNIALKCIYQEQLYSQKWST